MKTFAKYVPRLAPVCALIAALAAAGAAQAECRLSLSMLQDRWSIRHDPFVDDVAQQHFDVSIENRGDSPCSGALGLRLNGDVFGLARLGSSERLPYSLIDQRNGVDVTPRAGANLRQVNARPIALEPGERQIVNLSMVVVPQVALGDGDYEQDVIVGVATLEGLPLAERQVTLELSVPPAAVMGLKGAFQRTSDGARIDLGQLSEGRRNLATSLYVASTGGYRVDIDSANAGRLRIAGGDWTVPYELAVGDRRINLAQGDEIRVASRRPRLDSYPLSISLGDPGHSRAGEYSDTIRLTVTPF